MDSKYSKSAEQNADELARQIETRIPDARIKNLGWLIVVILPNKSTFTLNLLSADTADVAGEDCNGKHWDLTGASWQQALNVLVQANGLTPATNEETTTGAVAGYNTPGAFARPGQKSNRGTEQSEREGWTRIGEEKKRDQSGRKDARRDFPFGEDPLGEKELHERPNKRSEGRRKTETGHNCAGGSPLALSENQTSETLSYLAEMLPADSAEIDGNKLTVTVGGATILISAEPNGNFSIQTMIDGETIQANDNVAAGELIKWTFIICEKIREVAAQWEEKGHEEKSPGNDHIPPSDVYEILRELAEETGKPADLIRNKSLFDLRQGLVTARPPFDQRSGRRFFGDDFNPGSASLAEGKRVCAWCKKSLGDASDVEGTTHGICPDCRDKMMNGTSHVTESFHGPRSHDGHPVSINENRDLSRPYADTLGGKRLVYVPGQGAIFVNAADIPPKKKLSWNARDGVVLEDENAPAPDRKNMWKYPHRF